jgi:hypothetical protein
MPPIHQDVDAMPGKDAKVSDIDAEKGVRVD